jgi:5-methylcytosine-specific restriction endonuclease McrA
MSTSTVTAPELGFDPADVARVYRKGTRTPVERELRARLDVMLLEAVRAGQDADELADALGVERRRLSRALTRAKVTCGERQAPRNGRTDKQALANRDGARCHYCGTRRKLRGLTVDHVVPLTRGGSNARANKVLACRPCNAVKGGAIFVGRLVFQ